MRVRRLLRGAFAAGAVLVGAAVPAAAQDAGAAHDANARERTWTLRGAIGDSQRLDWGEGRNIPLLALAWSESDLASAGWRLDARYVSSWVSAELRSPFRDGDAGPSAYAGIGAETEVQSGLQSPYRYANGDYLRRRVFYTTYASASIFGGVELHAPDDDQRSDLRLRYQLRRHWFADAPDTVDGWPLPVNHVEHRVSLDLVLDLRDIIRAGEIWHGWGVWGSVGGAYREKWRHWGDTPETLTRSVHRFQGYEWAALSVGLWRRFWDHHHVRVELGGAIGDDLDRLSGFGVGSVWGTFPFTWAWPGYYYGEYKADRVLQLSSDYSADLTTHLRGYVYLDTGLVRPVSERTRWLTSVGVGLRIGVDVGAASLLPILVRYSYAPRAHRGASSRGGHELSVRILFAL